MNRSLFNIFWTVLRFSLQKPSFAYFVLKTSFRQKKAARVRAHWEERGIHVPPYLIMSITNQCNLKCKGCYAMAHHRPSSAELTLPEWKRVIGEAQELGISVVLIAGGEPLVKGEILEVTRNFPTIIFPLFTNGLLIDAAKIQEFKAQPHVIPVISLEGMQAETDLRRGEGVHRQIFSVMRQLKSEGIFYGVSITVTRDNFALATSPEFIKTIVDTGGRVVFFVEYIPIAENTAHLAPTHEQRDGLNRIVNDLHHQFNALFVAFPGDEELYGGCLAAGRGFVHISADGRLEPCPFAPYADANLKTHSLREALQSDFLRAIRQNHPNLKETAGGCALWANREWVASLLEPK